MVVEQEVESGSEGGEAAGVVEGIRGGREFCEGTVDGLRRSGSRIGC